MYFVGTQGGVCRDCDLPSLSLSNWESGGAAMLRSARSGLRAAVVAQSWERADVWPLYTTSSTIKPPYYTVNSPTHYYSLSFSPSCSLDGRRRGAQIPTNALMARRIAGNSRSLRIENCVSQEFFMIIFMKTISLQILVWQAIISLRMHSIVQIIFFSDLI